MAATTSGSVYSKAAWDKLGRYDESIHPFSDFAFNDVYSEMYGVSLISEAELYYRVYNNASADPDIFLKNAYCFYVFRLELFDNLKRCGLPQNIVRLLNYQLKLLYIMETKLAKHQLMKTKDGYPMFRLFNSYCDSILYRGIKVIFTNAVALAIK